MMEKLFVWALTLIGGVLGLVLVTGLTMLIGGKLMLLLLMFLH